MSGKAAIHMTTPLVPVPKLGQHQLSLDSGIVILQVNGALSLEEVELLMDYIHRCGITEPNLGMLLLANGEFSVTPEARRFVVKNSRTERPPVPVAMIGSRALLRAVLMLLLNAIRLSLRMDVPVSFFSTEAPARAWLTEQLVHRTTLLAKYTSRS